MISSQTTWDAEAVERLTTGGGGKILLAMATELQSYLMKKMNVSNPPPYKTPSKPGEYLRKRIGYAQAHVVLNPKQLFEVTRLGRVRVGYGQSAFYAAVWEAKKDVAKRRKGILAAFQELKPRLMSMAARKL